MNHNDAVFVGWTIAPKNFRLIEVDTRAAHTRSGERHWVDGIQISDPSLMRAVGDGTLSWAEHAAVMSNMPRSHTPSGVIDVGEKVRQGYGTALYTGLCMTAHLVHDGTLRNDWERRDAVGDGISSLPEGRSDEASEWWDRAINVYGLAQRNSYTTKAKRSSYVPFGDKRAALSLLLSKKPELKLKGTRILAASLEVDYEAMVTGKLDVYPYSMARRKELPVVIAGQTIRYSRSQDTDKVLFAARRAKERGKAVPPKTAKDLEHIHQYVDSSTLDPRMLKVNSHKALAAMNWGLLGASIMDDRRKQRWFRFISDLCDVNNVRQKTDILFRFSVGLDEDPATWKVPANYMTYYSPVAENPMPRIKKSGGRVEVTRTGPAVPVIYKSKSSRRRNPEPNAATIKASVDALHTARGELGWGILSAEAL